jgi:hypothetical protein
MKPTELVTAARAPARPSRLWIAAATAAIACLVAVAVGNVVLAGSLCVAALALGAVAADR